MTMNRRKFIYGATVAGAGLALAGPSMVRAQGKTFRISIITPPKHPWNVMAERVASMFTEETQGRYAATVFHAGQLGTEAAMLQQMQSGALDMAFLQSAEPGMRVPEIGAIHAPRLVNTTEKVAALVQHPEVVKLLDLLPQHTGTVGLGWGITGMRSVFAAKELNSAADINGMKLRINTTPQYRDFYQLLGAAPTPIPTPQVFDAMANGQVDGLEADLDFSWNQRFDQVSKSILRMNALFMPLMGMVSGRVWQSMSSSDQELLKRITKTALDEMNQEVVGNEPGIIAELEKTGIPMRVSSGEEVADVIEAWDAMWIERAPNIPRLRAAGAEV